MARLVSFGGLIQNFRRASHPLSYAESSPGKITRENAFEHKTKKPGLIPPPPPPLGIILTPGYALIWALGPVVRRGEDKTWTTLVDRVHGPPVMVRVHGHFFLNNEKWAKTEIKQK